MASTPQALNGGLAEDPGSIPGSSTWEAVQREAVNHLAGDRFPAIPPVQDPDDTQSRTDREQPHTKREKVSNEDRDR
jgi:hypothetical protein